MFTRFPRREIRLVRPGPWRRVHPALAMLVAGLALSAGCSPVLARLPKEASSTVASTAVAGAPTVVPRAAPAVNTNAQPLVVLPTPDWPVPDGHFYTQTNGQPPLASPTGYSVTNRDGIPFWDEFQRLGGPAVVGYPISPRFSFQGSISQVFQRAVLQWNAQARQVHLMNVLQAIDEAGKGDWLVQTYRVPARLPASFDRGKNWDETAGDRLALLRADRALEQKYRSAPDPLAIYGLPDSQVVDQGDHRAIRLQRTVLRLWKQDKPWAKAGEVTADNSGEYAVQAGLFPREAMVAEQPSTVPVSLDLEGRHASSVTAPSSPVPTPVPSQVGVWQVANTDGDGVYLRRTPRLSDKLAAWPEGTLLKSLGEQTQGEGLAWEKVQAPDGSVGWVPARYVKPVR